MFFFVLNQVSTFSILIASIIAMARYAGTVPAYRPFIFFIWVGACNDTFSMLLVFMGRNNLINSNLYVLIEYMLLLLIFHTWNDSKKTKLYFLLLGAGCIVWIVDNVMIHSLYNINSGFRVFYAFVILFLSVQQVKKLIRLEKKALITNAMFQICMCFIFYFSCKAYIETFYILDMDFSNAFNLDRFSVLLFINLFSNLIYAIAILCIPRKQEFTIQ